MSRIIYVLAGIVIVSTNVGWMAERHRHAETRAAWAAERAAADRAILDLATNVLETTSELHNAEATHESEAAALHRLADRHRADALAAGQRVHDAATAAADRARAQCASAAVADVGEAAGDAAGVLAHVLSLADSAAGRMAEIAQQRGDKGLACERRYEEARQAVNGQE
jgi:hypothetical protein